MRSKNETRWSANLDSLRHSSQSRKRLDDERQEVHGIGFRVDVDVFSHVSRLRNVFQLDAHQLLQVLLGNCKHSVSV